MDEPSESAKPVGSDTLSPGDPPVLEEPPLYDPDTGGRLGVGFNRGKQIICKNVDAMDEEFLYGYRIKNKVQKKVLLVQHCTLTALTVPHFKL